MKKEIIFDLLTISTNVTSREFISEEIPDKRCKNGVRLVKRSIGVLYDTLIQVSFVDGVSLMETYDIFNLGEFIVIEVNKINSTIKLRSVVRDIEVHNFRLSNKLLATLV